MVTLFTFRLAVDRRAVTVIYRTDFWGFFLGSFFGRRFFPAGVAPQMTPLAGALLCHRHNSRFRKKV